MLCQVVEQIPFAVCITDMRVPGLPITACNAAMANLTGYPKSEICGRNCRFLQGAKTEASAVREMVVAIRTGKKTNVRVTNYKRDGSTFLNSVTLSPVHDETGMYRFSIGVLSDAENALGDGPALNALCAALPHTMQAASQPPAFDPGLSEVTEEATNHQYRSAVVTFTRLQWSTSWEKALLDMVAHEPGLIEYSVWLQREAPEDVTQLELITKATAVVDQPISEAGPQALEICYEYLGASLKEGWAAVAMLKDQLQHAVSTLASGSFLSFVQSKNCLSVIDKMISDSAATMVPRHELLWSGYTVPKDCAGWVHAFTSVAEHHPACIVLSDMSIPGNPMVFVNQAFCRVTEYAKHEASGRNCRFLQGPQTEPESVAVIQDTLRRGVDCHVRITNYRKSGELFENLLTMRPVHDSNAVYRYSIGVQYEVSQSRPLEAQVADLEGLLALLPLTIEVSSQAIGLSHRRALNQEEKSADLWVKLERAMAKDIVRPA
jgi:PAS domain S-box-containing protein